MAGGTGAAHAQDAPAGSDLPVSLARIREAVERPAALKVDLGAGGRLSVVRFETRVEQRTYMVSFEEDLHQQLQLTLLQRQSRDWGSRCCGVDLDVVLKPIERALQRRKERKVRERIGQELAELEAATARK